MITRGQKSSEFKAALICWFTGVCFGLIALFRMNPENINLSEVGILVGAITLPLGGYYTASRTIKKFKHGEIDNEK